MSDHQGKQSAVSRRTARTYDGEDAQVELGHVSQGSSSSSGSSESRYGSADDETDDGLQKRRDRCSSGSYTGTGDYGIMTKTPNLGRSLEGLFPSTQDDISKSVTKVLQAAKEHITENALCGRPHSFGVVLPGTVYRSSFPLSENHEFLQTLGLKTVITLVNKEYPEEFLPFLNTLGVRHIIIDMKGTKKVPIPDHIMRSIIRTALDTQNHPVLLHCNHGKHRTGCATAIIRHVAGWDLEDILEEYKLFAAPKARDCDLQYIKNFKISQLDDIFLAPVVESAIPHSKRPMRKQTKFILAAFLLICICLIITLYFRH